MTKSISADSITALNLALAGQFKNKFTVMRPHHLVMIEKQLKQLASKGDAYQVAHAAYMVHSLRPFATNNARTALALLLDYRPVPDAAGLIKHAASVEVLVDALERA